MFKNRTLQVSLTKPNEDTTSPLSTRHPLDYDAINTIAKERVKQVAVVGGGLFFANKLVNTACEIAVIAAKAKIR